MDISPRMGNRYMARACKQADEQRAYWISVSIYLYVCVAQACIAGNFKGINLHALHGI